MPGRPRLAVAALTVAIAVPFAHSDVAAQSLPDAVMEGLIPSFETVSGNFLAAAEQVPADRYSYRPADEVRSFAEQFDHVADAHFAYCAAASGQTPPAAQGMNAQSKDQIVRRLRASRDFCLEAYRTVDRGALAEEVNLFGGTNTRVGILVQNLVHDNSHYGNVVTYLRSIGMVPPSSQ